MLHLLRIVSLALVTSLAAGSARAIDPFFPTFGNNGIDVLHYDLDLDVTPDTGRLDAEADLLDLCAKPADELHARPAWADRVEGDHSRRARGLLAGE